jgi:hypothetical protein
LLALLIDHRENDEPRAEAMLDHQSHGWSQVGTIVLNGRETFAADPQKSLWEKLALEVVQEHCAHPRELKPHERQLQLDLARTHCL